MKNSKAPPIPAYFKLQTIIREEIEKGKWKPGDAIPTEHALAGAHQISVGTVKKALLNLANEGYLYRIQGKGTFVAGTTIKRESLRYYRLLERFGGTETEFKVRFLKLKSVKFSEPAASALKLANDQRLFRLERLFISGDAPLIYNVSYLPQRMFPDLDRLPRTCFETTPLYLLLEEKYRLPTLYNQELFDAGPAGDTVAGILKIPAGTPVLHIEMIAFTYKETPYEYRLAYCLTNHHRVFREI